MSNHNGARAFDALLGRIASQLRPGRAAPQGPPTHTLQEWLPAVSPNWEWQAPHLRLLQEELQAVTERKVDRLMLFLPPRHGKSELVTVRYPVFRLEQNPETRVIIGAYNQALAERFSRKARRLARERLPLSKERSAAWDWETAPPPEPHPSSLILHPSQSGGVRAVGVGGGITGLGADLILIDDPVKSREEAESPAYRDRVWDWYRDDLYTRQEPGCAIILVMTRWHEDDLAGRILRSEEGGRWRVVRLPALAESAEEYQAWAERLRVDSSLPPGGPRLGPDSSDASHTSDPSDPASARSTSHFSILNLQFSIPERDPLGRSEGAPLWPQRFTAAALARIKTTLGARSFASLYQGRPLPAEGGLFKREWFRIVDDSPGPASSVAPAARAAPPEPDSDPGPGRGMELIRYAPTRSTGGMSITRFAPEHEPNKGAPAPLHPSSPQESGHFRTFRLHPSTRWVRFWDTAAKAGQRSDYWAGALLGRTSEGEWVLADVIRGRWEYPEAKRRVLAAAAADGAGVPVVIEDSANGIALLQDLRADPAADGYLIRAEKVTAEKAVRAGAWASLAESGRFRLVRGAWNASFLAEVETFPHGAHDDQVDAVSGAHAYLFRLRQVRKPVALAGRPRPMW